jgi:hypothetical protein
MLRATPFHRDNYSHLIVSVIHQFYQRCHERFKGAFPLFPSPLFLFQLIALPPSQISPRASHPIPPNRQEKRRSRSRRPRLGQRCPT